MQEYEDRFTNLDVLLHKTIQDQKAESNSQLMALQKDFDAYKAETEQKLTELENKLSKQIEMLDDTKANKKVLKKYLISLVENI